MFPPRAIVHVYYHISQCATSSLVKPEWIWCLQNVSEHFQLIMSSTLYSHYKLQCSFRFQLNRNAEHKRACALCGFPWLVFIIHSEHLSCTLSAHSQLLVSVLLWLKLIFLLWGSSLQLLFSLTGRNQSDCMLPLYSINSQSRHKCPRQVNMRRNTGIRDYLDSLTQ